MENPKWSAGQAGGRPLLGPWKADAFHAIRGVALAPDGKLWVAEGDAFPKRFSVWDTSGKEGKLVREFFGPANPGAQDAAIYPLDPDVMFAQGCEWRIDRKTGLAKCLGVVTREPILEAEYAPVSGGRYVLVIVFGDATVKTFARTGEGLYQLVPESSTGGPKQDGRWLDIPGRIGLPKPLGEMWIESPPPPAPWRLINKDGFALAVFFDSDPAKGNLPDKAVPGIDMTHAAVAGGGRLTLGKDRKVYLAAGDSAYWNLEVTGLEKVSALPGGKLTVPAAK
jgi:hypothetical protein